MLNSRQLLAACVLGVILQSSTSFGSPYTGTAPACSALSTGTCRVDVVDFVKTKYSYLGYSLNFDNAGDTSANSFRAAAGRRLYRPSSDTWEVISNVSVPFGVTKHPTLANTFIRAGTTSGTSKSLDFWVWGGGNTNALHNLSEISYVDGNSWFKAFSTANTPTYQDSFQNRGLFWSDYKFDVTVAGSGVWSASPRSTPVHGLLDFNYGNVLQHERWETYDPNSAAGAGTGVQRVSTFTFFSNLSDPQIINRFGGTLPTTLEALKITHSIKRSDGLVTQWETYYYGRQRLAGGTYNYFGLIYHESGARDTAVCFNGVPTSSHPNATCDAATNTYIVEQSSYSAFVAASPSVFYSQALGSAYKNDPKFTRRVATDSYGNTQEHSFKTQNRGGFMPQGPGADSTNSLVVASDWVYLESNGASEDVYMYVTGEDPIKQPTPVNYCRDGYAFVGAMVTPQSYSVIKYAGGTRGDWAAAASGTIGTVYPTSPGAHWIVFCASSNTSGPMMYVNASNSGEASCTSGYVTRLWFNANHAGVSACPAGSSCFDGTSKNFINMCVRADQCVGACMGTSNP